MQKLLENIASKRRNAIAKNKGNTLPRNVVLHKGLRRLIRMPGRMLWALFLESVETKEMIQTFVKQGRGLLLVNLAYEKPTEEELKKAHQQLRDLPKFLPFFVLVVVPLPGVTEGYALMAFTLENWLGSKVKLLPSQFRKVFERGEEELKS